MVWTWGRIVDILDKGWWRWRCQAGAKEEDHTERVSDGVTEDIKTDEETEEEGIAWDGSRWCTGVAAKGRSLKKKRNHLMTCCKYLWDMSFSPLVSRVTGCFRAMWWTLTHTFVLPFSSSLRDSLHWLKAEKKPSELGRGEEEAWEATGLSSPPWQNQRKVMTSGWKCDARTVMLMTSGRGSVRWCSTCSQPEAFFFNVLSRGESSYQSHFGSLPAEFQTPLEELKGKIWLT